jgi:DNA-binding NtrC family response regulator
LPNRGGRHGIDVRAPETGRAPKAVVVDDNDLLRTVLVHGLRARGMEVSEARNAAEARTLLGAGTAMLVSDIVLPGDMDGFILGRWARARNPRLALLFISAFMSARLPQVLANDELASFVRKPIELEGLIEIVDGLMAVRETSAPQLEA